MLVLSLVNNFLALWAKTKVFTSFESAMINFEPNGVGISILHHNSLKIAVLLHKTTFRVQIFMILDCNWVYQNSEFQVDTYIFFVTFQSSMYWQWYGKVECTCTWLKNWQFAQKMAIISIDVCMCIILSVFTLCFIYEIMNFCMKGTNVTKFLQNAMETSWRACLLENMNGRTQRKRPQTGN